MAFLLLFLASLLGFASSQTTQYTVTSFAGLRGSTTFADGQGSVASFSSPSSLANNSDGSLLFVADTFFHRIRLVNIPTTVVSTLAGNGSSVWADGTGALASFSFPQGVVAALSGTYVCDSGNHRIRSISPSGVVTTVAGNGTSASIDSTIGTAASFDLPTGLALSPDGQTLYVTDFASGRLRAISIASTAVSTLSIGFTLASPAGLAMALSKIGRAHV
jgi:sugar lactone lactonase YvrE